jgi:hypothetical protein
MKGLNNFNQSQNTQNTQNTPDEQISRVSDDIMKIDYDLIKPEQKSSSPRNTGYPRNTGNMQFDLSTEV